MGHPHGGMFVGDEHGLRQRQLARTGLRQALDDGGEIGAGVGEDVVDADRREARKQRRPGRNLVGLSGLARLRRLIRCRFPMRRARALLVGRLSAFQFNDLGIAGVPPVGSDTHTRFTPYPA